MHSAGRANTPDYSMDPSARKKRGPQDDKEKGTAEAVPLHSICLLSASVTPW